MDLKNFIDQNSFYPLHKTHVKTEKQFKVFSRGLVSYEETQNTFVVAGDPICKKKTDIPKVLDEFVGWAGLQNKMVCGYYFSKYVAEKNKSLQPYFAGVTLGSNLLEFKLSGSESRDIRRSLNYGKRKNLFFEELPRSKYFEQFFELKNLESSWFKNKSSFKKIKFLLSSIKLDDRKISDRHFIVKNERDKIIAYVSLDRFKEKNKKFSFYVDHMFQAPKIYKLALDNLLANIILLLKSEGHKYLDFGFCPFHDVKPTGFVESGLFISRHIKYLYNSKGLYKYKKKFSNFDKPCYLLLDPKNSKIKQVLALSKVTFH